MLFWTHHPIYDALGVGAYLNDLEGEYRALSPGQRARQLKRVVERELLLRLTGQKWRQTKRLPAGTRRILWVYDWTTLGDSIMDLSQRFAFPDEIAIDLCITKGPAELFDGDSRFRHIYRRIEDCPRDYDFILLHCISTTSIKLKLRHYPRQPFATLLDHQQGERYARIDFAALRLERLLGHPRQPPLPPRISPAVTDGIAPQAGHIAVALGGRDGRRRWRDWPGLLDALVRDWPPASPEPRFVLIGNGPSARDDLAAISAGFVERHCTVRLDLPDLAEAAREIQRCALFIGADGGLMHIAAALDKPGVALFAEIRPEWRLLPGNPLTPLYTPGAMADIPPAEIAATFIAAVQRTTAPAPQLSHTP
ncbi:glycosyltransferase family 9 protein [Oryzomicrobium sp.]|uniref:glycosyltransferase family 9 protein n=1 Tax=Oryzomicrobium sp. TaxID=1911578 RepID=UPI0025DE931D|nr:glycosyltransferase family 9 protein [Oryzomicrobium sp.]MCE1242920.1 hypothetical protein [Oryzomicrobium sp.]